MAETIDLDKPLPVGSKAPHNTGLWGVWALIVTEASLFGYLIVSYLYLGLMSRQTWPPDGSPELLLPGINTGILLLSSGAVALTEYSLRRGKKHLSLLAMGMAIVLGCIFVGMQMHEWSGKGYGPAHDLYASLYFTMTGFHMAHVVVGIVILTCLFVWIAQDRITPAGIAPLTIGGLYWHFVDAVWIVIFSLLFVEPHFHG
ncbi:cytochrome c oxidase subunit 3 [Asticcacaulis taihuensis]|uniref:cytochrome c oxidase subunit 3 n=1 Tax=Asticcacaulis taihuensis TaxID=260084 RepID=UPI0026F1DD74|nr:cytochrome c oxidase subunit 3 [Asticcacaulis taihuensis]